MTYDPTESHPLLMVAAVACLAYGAAGIVLSIFVYFVWAPAAAFTGVAALIIGAVFASVATPERAKEPPNDER